MTEPEIPDLPLTPVSKILKDEECPNVSIIIPCYQRKEFISLILTNIVYTDYPKSKLEVCILQDGDVNLLEPEELEFFRQHSGCRINYQYEKGIRRSIGEKRNKLVKMASHKFIACMDSDDIYFPTYIRYSVSALLEFKAGITSSASMLFIYPELEYKITGIRCGHKFQGHEACMVFTKKHWKQMSGFISRGQKGNQGEGVKMISYNEKQMVNLDVSKLMMCVCHNDNTISKDRFIDAEMEVSLDESFPHLVCLKKIISQMRLQNSPS